MFAKLYMFHSSNTEDKIEKYIEGYVTPDEFSRSSQALNTDLTLPGTASFKAET